MNVYFFSSSGENVKYSIKNAKIYREAPSASTLNLKHPNRVKFITKWNHKNENIRTPNCNEDIHLDRKSVQLSLLIAVDDLYNIFFNNYNDPLSVVTVR